MWAAFRAESECFELLLPISDPRAQTRSPRQSADWSVAHAASWGNDDSIVERLLPFDVAGMIDREGNTPLMTAARCRSEHAVRAWLPVSDPRSIDFEGRTALILALMFYDSSAGEGTAWEAIVRALFPVSDLNQRTVNGLDASDVAEGNRDPAAGRLLRALVAEQLAAREALALREAVASASRAHRAAPRESGCELSAFHSMRAVAACAEGRAKRL